ncbi:MAG: oligosaccharide flippase family protein [Nitrospirae bacterium]|nr:oligosaccharide flippase family protein [Nitrospirota bacterium]
MSLLKSSSLIFAGLMIGSIANYLFQVTMGRILTVTMYGELNALFSITAIFGVPFASLTTYLAKSISHDHAIGRNDSIKLVIKKAYKSIGIAIVVIFLIGGLFSGFTSERLKMDSIIPVLLLFLYIGISTVTPVNMGILQGLHNFRMISFLSAGGGVLKYLFGVALVALGLGLNGVMAGMIIAGILVGYLSFIPIKKEMKPPDGPAMINDDNNSTPLSFFIPVIVANLAFAVLTQSDIIMVKYFFSPEDAGFYSSAAVIGKTVMYIPGAIVLALFPSVASSKAREEGTMNLILKALALTVLMSGGGALVLYFFPGQVISVFFGGKFAQAAHLIGLFAIVMLPMAFIMVLMNYNLARGSCMFVYIMIFCSLFQVAGISVYHNSLKSVLRVILLSGSLCGLLMFIALGIEYFGFGAMLNSYRKTQAVH